MDGTARPGGSALVAAGWTSSVVGLALPLGVGWLVGSGALDWWHLAALPAGAALVHGGERTRARGRGHPSRGGERTRARGREHPSRAPGRPREVVACGAVRTATAHPALEPVRATPDDGDAAADPALARRRRLGEVIQALGAVLVAFALWRLGLALWRLVRHDWAIGCHQLYVIVPAVFAGTCGAVAARLGGRIRRRAAPPPRGSG
ncbi:hypothetical protein AB0I60_12810 [Actinosynnema sp. NPDC050436]|uniref:hypothetical protein n=1 Tax=Actinosynnema sp. NPDC050436 TaxID=3155659 RepID=UPI0033EB14CC